MAEQADKLDELQRMAARTRIHNSILDVPLRRDVDVLEWAANEIRELRQSNASLLSEIAAANFRALPEGEWH